MGMMIGSRSSMLGQGLDKAGMVRRIVQGFPQLGDRGIQVVVEVNYGKAEKSTAVIELCVSGAVPRIACGKYCRIGVTRTGGCCKTCTGEAQR